MICLKGVDIHIPTIMVAKKDGERLIEYVNKSNEDSNHSVVISVEFELVNFN